MYAKITPTAGWATWPAVLAYIVLVLNFLTLVESQNVSMFDEIAFGSPRRQLKAAVPTGKFAKRAPVVEFPHNLELKYTEGIVSLSHYF